MRQSRIPMLILALVTAFGTPAWGSSLDYFEGEEPWDDSVLEEQAEVSPDALLADLTTLSGVEAAIRATPGDAQLYPKAAAYLAAGGYQGFKVYVSGAAIDFSSYDNVQPVVQSGRTLVPLRAIVEGLGANVSWNAETREITIVSGSRTVVLTLDSETAYVQGTPVKLEVPAATVGGRTLVPLRFLSEAFGKTVGWYPSGGTQVIAVTD